MKSIKELCSEILCEAIQNKDFDRAKDVIHSYLKKNRIYNFTGLNEVTVNGVDYFGDFVFSATTNYAAYLMWKRSKSTEIDGVAFFDDANEVLYQLSTCDKPFLQMARSVVLNHEPKGPDFNVVQMIKLAKEVVSGERQMDYNSLDAWLRETFHITESAEELNESALDAKKARDKARRQLRKAELAGDEAEIARLQAEFARLDGEFQAAKGQQMGVSGLSGSSKVKVNPDPEVEVMQKEYEKRATPNQRFQDMENYVNMVLKGLQPSAVICGAPGVGKTYRITQKVRAKGYKMLDNYFLIKGKATPMSLYQTLFEYSHKGDLIVIDDADDIIKNELSINLLKAACDSSDERWVNYGTSKPIPASPERVEMNPDLPWEYDEKERPCYPRSFEFKGSIIIITNMQAGQLDTALKNRSLLCDLCFTVKECLSIVHDLMPKLGAGKLSEKSKQAAYAYLKELCDTGAPMEVSLRSFNIVANIIEATDGDDASAQRMINEQMKLQFSRGGKRY